MRALLLAIAGLLSPIGETPAERTAAVAAIEQCAATLAGRGEFAGSVAVALDGEILFAEGYGGDGPARETASIPHNIGSMAKMFTAVAIGQLVDSGRMRFDDPIGRHLSGLPPEIGRITVEQLLTHRSGLGDYLRIENREAIASARSARDLVEIAIAGGLRFEPGTRSAYSNSGFVLLGAAIEQVSGLNYADYVRQHVLGPAGMNETHMEAPPNAATPMTRMALQPGAAPSPERRPAPAIGGGRASPAGGAYSNAADLVRFAGALTDNRLTRPETTAALLRMAVPPADGRGGDRAGYALGFNLWEVGGTLFAGHGGGAPGVNGELSFSPAVAVAALSHYDPPSASHVTAFASPSVDPALCGTLAAPPPPRRPGGAGGQ